MTAARKGRRYCFKFKYSLLLNTTLTHQALAALVGGKLVQGSPDGIISGLNSLDQATAGEVAFLGNPRYAAQLKTTQATAVLVAEDFDEEVPDKALIKVKNPTLAFSVVIEFFGPKTRPFVAGIHSSAVVSASAKFDVTKIYVGPCVIIEDDAVIGDGTSLHGGVFIGQGAVVGSGCLLHANATVQRHCVLGDRVIIHSGAVIGSDGFGYELVKGCHQKIPQVGIVQLEDDVEVGACSTIDRARFGKTYIGAGTKIDNLVQIAHNVTTGKHCVIVSQTAIAGSTRLGNYVVTAGQCGIAGHLTIGDQITFLARSGVTKDHQEAGYYTGFPAKPLAEGRRLMIAAARVPVLSKKIRDLEKRLAALEKGRGE
jgi:UDP-3-O-[3-hydroxymyristoyl] glucosamine N-acyltransferase